MLVQKPRRPRPKRTQITDVKSVSAPVGGINARDSIAEMPPTDAIVMENWFPGTTNIAVRNGSQAWTQAIPGLVESLMAYSAQDGTRTLFAAAGAGIYDAKQKNHVNTAVVTGLTSAQWQHTNFGTPGGEFLVCVNGADPLQLFDGSNWQAVTALSTPIAITGIDTSSLIAVAPYKSRLIFLEKNSLRFWYLPVLQLGGAAASFDLGSQFRLGGYLMAFASWNMDTVQGPQDYAAFISSEGEVAIYQGYDPSIPGAWSLTGVFRIGRPIGRRCCQKVGSDVYVISVDGLYPLSAALLADRSQNSKALSNKITNLINLDVQLYGGNLGWQVVLYPTGNKLIINVPQIAGQVQYQYVMNTITGAWTKFTGWQAACWEVMGDQLFFGTLNRVVLADVGVNDSHKQISTDLKVAFSDFGASGQQKQWTMVRPVFSSDDDFSVNAIMNMDFADNAANAALTLPKSIGASSWNFAIWDSAPWAQGMRTRLTWETVGGIGFYASLRLQTLSKAAQVSLQSIDYAFLAGGVL